jgi:hypothetical protein
MADRFGLFLGISDELALGGGLPGGDAWGEGGLGFCVERVWLVAGSLFVWFVLSMTKIGKFHVRGMIRS